METQLLEVLLREIPKLGPTGLVLVGGGWLVWKLGGKINELKEAAFQRSLDDQAKRITTVENKLAAAELALVKLGAWSPDAKQVSPPGV